MYLFNEFKLLIILILLINYADVTLISCDCNKPVFVGILDTSEPEICIKSTPIEKSIPVQYSLISRFEPPLQEWGYLCRTFYKTIRTQTFFWGSYNIEHFESPLLTSEEDCWHMVITKKCDNFDMKGELYNYHFSDEPKRQFLWMKTVTSTIKNCELRVFHVTQDCTDCVISSAYGVLSTSNNITTHQSANNRFVWRVPKPQNDHCSFKATKIGIGEITAMTNPKFKRLRDNKEQLEFIFKVETQSLCDFGQVHDVRGVRDAFIYITESTKKKNGPETTVPIDTSTTPKPVQTTRTMKLSPDIQEGFLMNDGTEKICIGRLNDSLFSDPKKSLAIPVNCDSPYAVEFVLKDSILKMKSFTWLCLQTTLNDTIKFGDCPTAQMHTLIQQQYYWNYTLETGELGAFRKCLQYVQPSNPAITRKLRMLPCNSLANLNKPWRFIKSFDMQSDDPQLIPYQKYEIELAEHHQYVQGTSIKNENILSDKLNAIYCEVLKNKLTLIIALAQSSGMLAAQALGRPTCQRLYAIGNIIIIQQCKINYSVINMKRSKCGLEPSLWNNKTLSRDGYTERKFSDCYHSEGIINLNSKPFEFVNTKWKELKPNIKLAAAVGPAAHFEEIPENEVGILHSLESSFLAKSMEQIDAVGELLSIMQSEQAHALTQINSSTQSRIVVQSKIDSVHHIFVPTFSSILVFAILILFAILGWKKFFSGSNSYNIPPNNNTTVIPIPLPPPPQYNDLSIRAPTSLPPPPIQSQTISLSMVREGDSSVHHRPQIVNAPGPGCNHNKLHIDDNGTLVWSDCLCPLSDENEATL